MADCRSCEETLADFDDTNDSLIRHLPLAGGDIGQQDVSSLGWLQRQKVGSPSVQKAGNDLPLVDGRTISKQLQSYEITGIVGTGGTEIVYRAKHRQLNRPVAITIVSPHLMLAEKSRCPFDREIRVLGGLHHPRIVSTTDSGRIGPAAFLVMELVDEINLSRLVKCAGPVNIGKACEVVRQMATAPAVAHATGATHRDVEPSNVMTDRVGRIKLLNFGLPHVNESVDDHRKTFPGHLLETLD